MDVEEEGGGWAAEKEGEESAAEGTVCRRLRYPRYLPLLACIIPPPSIHNSPRCV